MPAEERDHEQAAGEKVCGADDLTVLVRQGEGRRAHAYSERLLGVP